MPTRLQLTHLCFTDDLVVFTDLPSIQVIKGVLEEFKSMSSLNAKSGRVFFFFWDKQEEVKFLAQALLPLPENRFLMVKFSKRVSYQ